MAKYTKFEQMSRVGSRDPPPPNYLPGYQPGHLPIYAPNYQPGYPSGYLMLPNLTNQFIKLSDGDIQCEWNLDFFLYLRWEIIYYYSSNSDEYVP